MYFGSSFSRIKPPTGLYVSQSMDAARTSRKRDKAQKSMASFR